MIEERSPEDWLPLLRETLAAGGIFALHPRGNSMLPCIRSQSDTVLLGSADPASLRRGDVILYRRADGRLALHRIVRRRGDGDALRFDTCGDALARPERDIPARAVLARMTGLLRAGEPLPLDAPAYRRYVRRRLFSRPFRRLFGRIAAWRSRTATK